MNYNSRYTLIKKRTSTSSVPIMARKDIELTKRQVMEIISISSDVWINRLAKFMLDEYGKSKTAWYPAYNQLLESGHIEKVKPDRSDDYPNRRYLRVVVTTESKKIKDYIASIETTRKQFAKGIRYLKKHSLLTKFTKQYEHNTISKGTSYVFINDRPTWKGEKVSQFNNKEFLKGKLISSKPLWLDVSYNSKSYSVFNALLHLIENLYNHSNSLKIGMELGHFDKMYEKTINSQYKKSILTIKTSLTKLIESFDKDQRDFIDNLIQQKFTWFEPLYEIFDKSDRFKRDYVEALPSRI